MRSHCRLRNRRDAQRLRGRQKVGDVRAAVNGTIGAECLVCRHDDQVRRPEQPEVLVRLPRRCRAVALCDADRRIKTHGALAPTLAVDAVVRTRPRQIGRRRVGRGGQQRRAQPLQARTTGDVDLPRLRVAP
ncbi:hypothetical protein D3C71_1524590 [compost metagenome]